MLLGCALFAVSCGRKPSQTANPPSSTVRAETNVQVFQARGTVVELQLAENTVRIRHEEIPGYMKAMTMPFEVRDARELDRLEAGDPVSFRLVVARDDAWIDQVKKLNAPANTNLPTSGPLRIAREVEELAVGDELPDYRFTDHLGQPVHLQQFRGGVLAITFSFTRCPYPTYCPLMSKNFETAQNLLLKHPGAPANWRLLTLSIDPEYDTPERLKSYAQTYNCDSNHWSFLTGTLVDVTAIAEQLGLMFWREPGGSINHNLRTAVFDARGRLRAVLKENKWTPEHLVEEILKAAKP